jgi:hypothetical protein
VSPSAAAYDARVRGPIGLLRNSSKLKCFGENHVAAYNISRQINRALLHRHFVIYVGARASDCRDYGSDYSRFSVALHRQSPGSDCWAGDRSHPQCMVGRCAACHRHTLRLGKSHQRRTFVGSIAGDGNSDLHRWVSLRTAPEPLRRLYASSRRLSDLYGV